MEISTLLNQVPSTIFVAAGVFLAALIGGLFSYLNMITAKENKVSEFRREWIDELRNQVALYTSSIQNLSLLSERAKNASDEDDNEQFKLADIMALRKDAIESITKITLMLNHKTAANDRNSHEAALLRAARKATKRLSASDYGGVMKSVALIRKAAGPLLKSNWETVKSGEKSYRQIKRITGFAYFIVMPLLFIFGVYYLHSVTTKQQENFNQIKKAIQESMLEFKKENENTQSSPPKLP